MRFALATMLLFAAVGCSRSPSPPAGAPKDGGIDSPSIGSVPRNTEILRGLDRRRELEFLPFNGRLLELIGERDLENRYATTVMVSVNEPPIEFSCNGVLIHPHLVLTAGHCVCQWRKGITPQGAKQTTIDSTSCASTGKITAILHEASDNPATPHLRVWERKGAVEPHPELDIKLDAKNGVSESRADLAVMLLEKPVDLRIPELPLLDFETEVGDPLVMVGYGSDPNLEQLFGNRYFRNGKVKVLRPLEGRVLYEPAEAYFNTSYRGGPCLRAREQKQWVAGIVGLGTDQEMSCTSTFPYRAWLQSELKRAAQLSDSLKP